MVDLHHEIEIDASPEKVYEAVATQRGLRGWWMSDSVAEPRVGSVAEFGFYNRANVFRMRVDELFPAKRVVWACLGESDEWEARVLSGTFPGKTAAPFFTLPTPAGALRRASARPAIPRGES